MKPFKRTTPEPSPVPGARWVPLTQGRFALVDEADWPSVSGFSWCVDSSGYAMGRQGRLHNFLMGAKGIDHVNGNKLDNRRANLRVATLAQNGHNRGKNPNGTSGFKGVSFCKQTGRWTAKILANGRTRWLGRHDTAEEAARAYDIAAQELHGEFARPNSVRQ